MRALTGVCSHDDPRTRIPAKLSILLLAMKAVSLESSCLMPAVFQPSQSQQIVPRLLQTDTRSSFLPRNHSNLLVGLPSCAQREGVKWV